MREGDTLTRSEPGGQVRTAAGLELPAVARLKERLIAIYEGLDVESRRLLLGLNGMVDDVVAEAEAAPSAGLPAEPPTIQQLLDEGWVPDGHMKRPHALDEDGCWCNPSAGLPAEALREALEAEWYNGNLAQDVYDRILAAAPSAPEAGLPTHRLDGLDVERLKQAMLNVGAPDGIEAHRMDFQLGFAIISQSQQQLAVWFAEAIAAEYARLRDSEASPIPPPLPGRSCRHGIVHDQCPYCDSPGADKEEATRRAIQRDSEATPPATPEDVT